MLGLLDSLPLLYIDRDGSSSETPRLPGVLFASVSQHPPSPGGLHSLAQESIGGS